MQFEDTSDQICGSFGTAGICRNSSNVQNLILKHTVHFWVNPKHQLAQTEAYSDNLDNYDNAKFDLQ